MWKDDLEGLMMLLDGVLDPTEEALMRARIVDEPELARQWNELRQLQGLLKHELKAELSPNFSDEVMKKVRQSEQVPPSFVDRLIAFLSRPIAVPVAAAAAVAIMWAIGLPNAVTPAPINTPAVATSAGGADALASGETEIESIDNPTDYNVLVLAAPGSPNRMIWISQRTLNDEG
jgi:anti-sigma factor RsiW